MKTLKLSDSDIQVIFAGLGEMKYREVAQTISNIVNQLQAQSVPGKTPETKTETETEPEKRIETEPETQKTDKQAKK